MAPRCKQCFSSVQTLIPAPGCKSFVCPKHGRIDDPRLIENEQAQAVNNPGNDNLSNDPFAHRERKALGRSTEEPNSVSWLSGRWVDDAMGAYEDADANGEDLDYVNQPQGKVPLSNNGSDPIFGTESPADYRPGTFDRFHVHDERT